LTVLAGAGADFLKSALTVTAMVCFVLNVGDEKRVRYMKIIRDERFWETFHPSPNFYLLGKIRNFSEIFFSSSGGCATARTLL
jgi:hypothetical protein